MSADRMEVANFSLDEVELARGHKLLAQQVADITRAKPGTRVRKGYPGVPLVFLETPDAPGGLPLLVDPLGILERAGIEVSCSEMVAETDEQSDWMRI